MAVLIRGVVLMGEGLEPLCHIIGTLHLGLVYNVWKFLFGCDVVGRQVAAAMIICFHVLFLVPCFALGPTNTSMPHSISYVMCVILSSLVEWSALIG